MARTTLTTRVASLETAVSGLQAGQAEILAILRGQQAPAKEATVQAVVDTTGWDTIKAAKAARAEKDVRCALNGAERRALAAKHSKALAAARKVSREAYDAKWLTLVTAAAAKKA